MSDASGDAILFAAITLLEFLAAMVWSWVALRLLRGQKVLPYEPRRRVPWSGGDVALLFLAAIMILAMAIGVAVGDQPTKDDPATIRLQLGAKALADVIFVGAAIAYLLRRKAATWSDVGFDTSQLGRDVLRGAIACVAMVGPVLLVQLWLVQFYESKHPAIDLISLEPTPHNALLITWIALITAPLAEEFIFRVLLQGWLESRERAWRQQRRWLRWVRPGVLPVVTSSALFAAAHIEHGPDWIPLFLLALPMGYLYRQTHRIFPSVAMHVLFNAITVTQLWFQVA